jgi:hypothetical protein
MNPPVDLLLLDSLALSHGEVDGCELFQTSMVAWATHRATNAYDSPRFGNTGRKVCFYSPTINRNHSGPTQLLRHSKPKRYFMRTYALAIAAAAIFAFPASAFSQGVEIGPGGVRTGGDPREASSQQECEELRSRCFQKDELGEQGDNCRRFHESCKRVGADN